MQATSSSGSYTYWTFTEGKTSGTHHMTLPDGPSSYCRLQMDSSGKMKMVSTAYTGTWVSFTITEVNHEAEYADITSGTIKSDIDNASGGKYVDGSPGFNLTWEVESAAAITRTLAFRIKVPSGTRSMGVYVNGVKKGTVTTSLTYWNTKANVSAALKAGTNTIELRDSEGTAELDVDYLKVY